MSMRVVDASVAAKWFLKEEHTEEAHRLLDGPDELHAPDFLLIEMDNVLCKRIRRGDVADREADSARAMLRELPLEYHPFSPLLDSAYSVAKQTRRSLYDCLYVALAMTLGGRMVTADRKLYDAIAAGPFAGYVVWVEDV